MEKIVKEQFMGIISFIFMVILSITGYAYLSDKDVSARDIQNEIIERKEADGRLMEADKDIRNELNNKVDQKSFDILLQRWDNIEQYILNK